ncbi:SDR family NAD(P)-dependent oxidoreductase [Flavobacterium aurantiibacter]|uniref:Short-chain dehydrogenase n=1 Tax=Flavobacterium aurantiibacter TaxID=2023067 RepID=A0A255ZSI1_9FLAO|nr:SDR family oxidoreductase [Flavobacterium aurantiibacter]OYQ44391.1 short-chain dehydrogenase [Flavobacterium aurantiibacter]
MKTFLVTGASRGIGLETVKTLLDAGARVVLVSRNASEVNLESDRLIKLNADLSVDNEGEKIASALKSLEISGIDGLVHNAGTLICKKFESLTLADFESVYRVNVFAVAMLTKALLPFLHRGSHVLGISSMGGIQGSSKFSGLAAYSSSKGALITLFELLAEEFKEQGIYFNLLALGAVQTEMLAEAFPDYVAPVTAPEMGSFIADFVQNGHRFFNGKVLPVALSTP